MLFKQFSSKVLGLCILVGLLALSGCGNLLNKKTLYEGEVPDAATILSFDTVQVEYIDNKSMPISFVGQVKEYGVLPGEHTLIIKYVDFWDQDSDEGDIVKSDPVRVTFTAEPKQTYQIRHEAVPTFKQSKAFAERPSFVIKNLETDQIVDARYEFAIPRSFMEGLKFEKSKDVPFVGDAAAASTANDSAKVDDAENLAAPSALEELQQLWGRATESEKTSFLQWITTK